MRREGPRPVANAINATLAEQLVTFAEKVARLEDRNAQLERRLAESDDLPWGYEEVWDAIADHKRGLIDTDELYDRTVGR